MKNAIIALIIAIAMLLAVAMISIHMAPIGSTTLIERNE